jgi:ribonuclease HI
MSKSIKIYTDGACSGNPGKGGYGIVMEFGNKRKELSAAFDLTTNNRMELLAVIVALRSLKSNKYPVICYTDSKYVCDSIEKGWLDSWVKKNFKGKKNVDLWKAMIPLLKTYHPTFKWVKGHAGHPQNERCDELAVEATENGPWQKDQGYIQES